MEHEVLAEADGVVTRVAVAVGDSVEEGQLLLMLEPGSADGDRAETPTEHPAGGERPTCGPFTSATRSASTRRVRRRSRGGASFGRRTARENLDDLLDEGTFVEYGPLLFAAQERRRSREELIARTPADGLVGGVGDVEGRPCVAMSYDYTVLAGTQGMRNHLKKDRLFDVAERRRLPVVLFAEGGGGRPGDVDMPIVAGLDCRAFALFAGPQRPRAARRDRFGLLLRRQRRAARAAATW